METKEDKYVYGLTGLAKLLSISKDAAFNLTKTGRIDSATIVRGSKKLMFDSRLVLKLLTKSELIAKEGGKNE